MVDARKRVVVARDTASPLWFIRCETPCRPDGRWCQGHDLDPPRAICWLGAGGDREKVAEMAERGGHYEVVG